MSFRLWMVLFFVAGMEVSAATIRNAKEFLPRKEVLAEFEKSFPNSGPVEAFFDKRDADPNLADCRKILDVKVEAFRKAHAAGDARAVKEIMEGSNEADVFHLDPKIFTFNGDAQSFETGSIIAGRDNVPATVTEKNGLVDILQACGPCVAMVRVEGLSTYESDGWCRKKETAEKNGSQFLTAEASLKKWSSYPRQKEADTLSGFNYILAFGQENELVPTAEIKSGDRAVIVVKAMHPLAFGYYGDIFFQRAKETVDYFTLQFAVPEELKKAKVKVPGLYSRVKDGVTGEKFDVSTLYDVWGHWFVDASGIRRYKTRANFGVPPLGPMKRMAHLVMMDAIWHMHEIESK